MTISKACIFWYITYLQTLFWVFSKVGYFSPYFPNGHSRNLILNKKLVNSNCKELAIYPILIYGATFCQLATVGSIRIDRFKHHPLNARIGHGT